MFGALKRGRFRNLASLILVVNVVGELRRKRTLAASRGFLAAARLSCLAYATSLGGGGMCCTQPVCPSAPCLPFSRNRIAVKLLI